MATWACRRRRETLDRVKHALPDGEFPDQVEVEAPEDATAARLRSLAAHALVAKVAAWGGAHEREVMQALPMRNAMNCTCGDGRRAG